MSKDDCGFTTIDNDDPRGPQAIFDCGTITVRIDRHLKCTITNDDTGYECSGVSQSDLDGMKKVAREKFGLPAEDKVEILVEVQPKEEAAEEEQFCPRCGWCLGKTKEAVNLYKCPDCEFQLKGIERLPEENGGILIRTFKYGQWI
ncbi:MAG: hypothetical protein WC297_02970 [Candidatus Paceibacterota bacterium]|jgi:predicted RNA-binding Zn-ribbon protein involved in translation (DUF1610 family)